MVINYTIAKGRHDTADDTLKLSSLIKASDVVSFEIAGATDRRAREVEEYFPRFYASTRHEREQLRIKKHGLTNTTGQVDQYFFQVTELIINNHKGVVQAERFSPTESLEIKRYSQEDTASQFSGMPSLETLMSGDYESITRLLEGAILRDQNIVENARSLLPTRIGELYPHLAERDELNYLISIGYMHNPEVGLRELPNTTVHVEDLTGDPKPWELLLYQKIQNGASYEQCQDDLARLFIKKFLNYLLPQTDARFDLSLWMIASMGVQEAGDLHSRIMNDPSYEAGRGATRAFFKQQGIEIPTNRKEIRNAMRKYVPKSL